MHNTILSLDKDCDKNNVTPYLDLGASKNYKTKDIQIRWEQER